jgi:hypothetical protein
MKSVATLVPLIAVMASAVFGEPIRFDDDGMLVVDGKRTFVLGLYENPKEDGDLDRVAAAGFNLVHGSESAAALDRLQARGLFAWINTGARIDLSQERAGREAALTTMVERWGGHPALLTWEVPDEALWNSYWRPMDWRHDKERKQQAERIVALEDKALASELQTMHDAVEDLFLQGRFEEMERTADDIWRKLGEEPPHPDLNLSTANERVKKLGDGMVQGYAFLKDLDARHPVWINHAPRNQIPQLAAFNAGADVVGCDIYPAPEYKSGHSDLANRSLAVVGAYTDRMQAAAPDKPVWMVLQGCGWNDLSDAESYKERRRPTLAESRFMAYDAIVHKARGILYWGTSFIEKDSELWEDLLSVGRELGDLQDVLTARDANLVPKVSFEATWGSVDRDICVLTKMVNGKTWLLVVNEWYEPLRYRLEGLEALEGVTYKVQQQDLRATVKNGALNFPIRGYGVQVLAPK